MSLQACAELVARGDPDRFRATMAAPLAAREKLLPLYALNLEVARAPWLTEEPMIAEMRLQFWRDVVEEATLGKDPRAHEVAAPLTTLIQTAELPLDVLDLVVAARRWDIYKDPFEDAAALEAYLDDTSGGLMWLAARALGATSELESSVRAFGQAAGLAALLQAAPELEARGRYPLVDGRAEAIKMLADQGLARISAAKKASLPKPVWPALWAGWTAEPVLKQVAANPNLVAQGGLGPSELAKSWGLFRRGFFGGY